jgi:hypothetical protein
VSARPLDLTQRQVKALCEGAKKAGYTPVIEIGNTVIRLVPEAPAVRPRAPEHVDEDGEIVDL